MACRFATCPTSRSPLLVTPTTEGVVRAPSWLGMTVGSPPCITATTELVVPKSMPIILLIWILRRCPGHRSPTRVDSRAIVAVECVYVKLLDNGNNMRRIRRLWIDQLSCRVRRRGVGRHPAGSFVNPLHSAGSWEPLILI